MKTVAIIQAHLGSSRLPGKVLMDVAGKPVLQRVIERVQAFREASACMVATSTLAIDDALAAFCSRLGVAMFRGSESDVLDRFRGAADAAGADVCVRITSDCPLIDPGVSDDIIRRFHAARPPVDYASNKIPQSFPRGLDTEVFTREALERAWRRAAQPYERAHVTIHMYEHPQEFRLLSIVSDVDRADWRWTVDEGHDLEFVRRVYERLDASGLFSWHEVLALLEREPALREINAHVRQKDVRAG